MKSLILFYSFLIIGLFLNISIQGATLKPSNQKFKIVKISDENKKTRVYYHLKKNEEMVFSSIEDFIDDPNATYSIKVITRAKISPNSNSSKTFGIELSILEDGIERNKILKYKKGVSSAKKSSKSGFNFTQAGFWFDELKQIKDSEILIKLVDGSPELDVRILINKINYRLSDKTLMPVNKEKPYKVMYKEDVTDSTYKTSKDWYLLDENSDLQFKIFGPKQIRIFTRKIVDADTIGTYGFTLRENGKYINNYLYNAENSEKEAHFINDDTTINISSFNSFFFNIPDGVNYYSFESVENSAPILLKIQSYIDEE